MLVCDYIVERIDGDYAMLKRTNLLEEEEKMVARALLPEEIRTWSAPPPPSCPETIHHGSQSCHGWK